MRLKKVHKLCSVGECQSISHARGFCGFHYKRMRKYGDPNITKKASNGTVKKWLEGKKDFSESRCLPFPFSTNSKGYGQIGFDRFVYAHRWMCHEVNGPAPPSKPLALHSCGNGHLACVNPHHLYWGSHKENSADAKRHGSRPFGERVGGSVLTAELVRDIRLQHLSGVGYMRLGKKYGVSTSGIRDAIKGKSWGWLS